MARFGSLPLMIALLVAALSLAGCAGTARGVKQSVYEDDRSISLADGSRSQADALVVIRFPAVVDEAAAAAYYGAFEQRAIGGSFEPEPQMRQISDQVAQSLISKSNYYSMSLYRELRDRLPPESVLLSPHVVELDGAGGLTSRPLLAAEEIPGVLTIDFGVYSHPDPERMMDSEPLTFGDLVTPLFVVHADRWLRPSTFGLLVASEPLLESAWSQSLREAEARMAAREAGRPADYRRPLDFIAFLDPRGPWPDRMPTKRPGGDRGALAAVEAHPLEKIRMDGEAMEWLTVTATPDPFIQTFVSGAATRVITALNRVDHDRATFFERQTALSRFDPELGGAFLARRESEDVRARLRMAEALVTAERKFVAAQSESLFAGAYEGDYGNQMRQLIAAEYRLLEQRRELARSQNLKAALAVVALAGAAYIGSETDGSDFLESSTMSNILVLSSVWAADSAIRANARSKTIGENFLVQMAPAIDRQVTVQVEWLNSREMISARDFAEFRDKTLALYQRSTRSIPALGKTDCGFLHPALDSHGRWYGDCSDGLANGNGYGVVFDGRGYRMEYLGAAKAGLAEGVGAMVYRSPGDPAPIYYEGGFRRSLPHGVLRVEEAGREARIRRFRDGRETGAAKLADLRSPRF